MTQKRLTKAQVVAEIAEMSELDKKSVNRVYRKKDRTTDVLAFPMTDAEATPRNRRTRLLGDLVVSVPVARKQARAANRELLDEVTMLLAHGLLHLVGWDHDTAATDRAMRAETDRLRAACQRRPRAVRTAQQRHSRARKPS